MIVGDKSPAGISNVYTRRLRQTEAVQREASSSGVSNARAAKDEIEISPEALVLQRAVDAAGSADEVRSEKVARLRQQVAQGEYKVPVNQLVDRLIADA